ncbi:glycosyl hydrolase family 28-related protein [Rothia mucilaginosa]|uniref:glycosyl hydrolase family 28-related protein n=1 Tax=Rothia mucilaginosa TaxID=43675 RepID=UPI0028E3210A|nr:glycosyl hydrolase family 28-related protein [Rothia mucilaginosa]
MRYLVEVVEQVPEAVEVQKQSPAKHRTVDVVAAGADPTGAADSTAAINQAIRRVHEAGGGTVHLPAGSYKVSAPFIELLGGVHLQGAGRESTIIFADTGAGAEQKTAVIHAGTWFTPRVGKDNLLMGVSDLWVKSSHARPSHVSSATPRPGQDGMHPNIGGILLNTELGDNPPEPDGAHRIENVLIWDVAFGVAVLGLDDQGCQLRNIRVRRTLGPGVVIGKSPEHITSVTAGRREIGAADNILDCVDVSGANIAGGTSAGFEIYATNTTLIGCKSWYNRRSIAGVEGKVGSIWDTSNMHRFTAAGAGFFIRGGRNMLASCTAQENGGHGVVIVGHSSQVTGCRSASSSWHDCVSGEAKPAEAADFFVTNWAHHLIFSNNIAQAEYKGKNAKYGFAIEKWSHDISGTSNMTVDIPTPHRATDMGVAVKLEINTNTIN